MRFISYFQAINNINSLIIIIERQCHDCGKTFMKENSFGEHLKIPENINFQCKECFKSFPTQHKLTKQQKQLTSTCAHEQENN